MTPSLGISHHAFVVARRRYKIPLSIVPARGIRRFHTTNASPHGVAAFSSKLAQQISCYCDVPPASKGTLSLSDSAAWSRSAFGGKTAHSDFQIRLHFADAESRPSSEKTHRSDGLVAIVVSPKFGHQSTSLLHRPHHSVNA